MVADTEGQVSATQFEIKRPTITNFSSNFNKDSRGDGMFIDISIHGVETYALLDSGSTITVMNRSIFEKIPTSMKPFVNDCVHNLRMANGDQSTAAGQVVLPIAICGTNQVFLHNVVITNIEVPVILGRDFMKMNNFHLNLGEDTVKINGQPVHCKLESELNSVFRICLDSKVVIHPGTERMVNAYVVGTQNQTHPSSLL